MQIDGGSIENEGNRKKTTKFSSEEKRKITMKQHQKQVKVRSRAEKERMGGTCESLAEQVNMDIRRERQQRVGENRIERERCREYHARECRERAGELKSAFDKRANGCLVQRIYPSPGIKLTTNVHSNFQPYTQPKNVLLLSLVLHKFSRKVTEQMIIETSRKS